jgi:hypothetical protein
MAARGTVIARFAWASKTPDCGFHPGLQAAAGKDPRCATATAGFDVGKHAAGASQAGLEDVLLSSSEIVASSPNAVTGVCRSRSACYVTGFEPGAIDISGPTVTDGSVPAATASFRCAFAGGRQ